MTTCTKAAVPLDIWQLVQAIDLHEAHGVLPWSGGSMQQTLAFREAMRVWGSEVEEWEQSKKKK